MKVGAQMQNFSLGPPYIWGTASHAGVDLPASVSVIKKLLTAQVCLEVGLMRRVQTLSS